MNDGIVRQVGEIRLPGPEFRNPYEVIPGSPIFVTWDTVIEGMPGVLEVAKQAVSDVQSYTHLPLNVEFHGTSWVPGDWGSTAWYTEQSKLPNGQINANRLISLYHDEPWQRELPHVDLVILGEDITSHGNNFLFGAAQGRVTIQSLFRFLQHAGGRQQVEGMVHWVVAHELGHLLGLLPDWEVNHDPRGVPGSLYHHHCRNLCYMGQVMSVEELATRLSSVAGRPIFCPDCQRILARG